MDFGVITTVSRKRMGNPMQTHPYVRGFFTSPLARFPESPTGTIFDLNFSKFFESIFS